MLYKNLDVMTEAVLGSLVLVLLAAAFIRAGAVAYRVLIGMRHVYPTNWTPPQCQTFEKFRLGVGVTLAAFWAVQQVAATAMPTNWPFGFLEATSVAVLLLLTNAWIVLLVPHDWQRLWGPVSSFAVTMAVLTAWWGFMFVGTALMFATSTRERLSVPIEGGPVVASLSKPIAE